MSNCIRLVSRKSPLSLKQNELFLQEWKKYNPNVKLEIIPKISQADKTKEPLVKFDGKGAFVSDFEKMLLEGKADIALHSAKDVPSVLESKFIITSVLKRTEARDVFISTKDFKAIADNSIIGTCSLRRILQLYRLKQKIRFYYLRGNINTRIKIAEEQKKVQGIILALIGIQRLNINTSLNMQVLSLEEMLPACNQGILVVECLSSRANELLPLLKPLNDLKTELCLAIERSFVAHLNAKCLSAIGCYAEVKGNKILFRVKILALNEKNDLSLSLEEPIDQAMVIAYKAANWCIKNNVKQILDEVEDFYIKDIVN